MISRNDVLDALSMLSGNDSSKTPKPDELTVRAWLDYYGDYPTWTGDELVAAAHELCKRPRERLVQPADLGEIIKIWRRDVYERSDPNTRESAYAELGGGVAQPQAQPTLDGGYIDGNGVKRDRFGYIDKSAPEEDEYPAEWTSEQRVKAYWNRLRERRDRIEYQQATGNFGSLSTSRPASDETRAAAIAAFANSQLAFDDDADDAGVPYVNPLLVRCPFCRSSAGEPCTMPGMPGHGREKLTGLRGHPARIAAAAVAAGHDEATVKAIVDAATMNHAKKRKAGWPEDLAAPKPVPEMPVSHPAEAGKASDGS